MEANWSQTEIEKLINQVTRPAQPTLLPELTLRLVTEDSDWWRLEPRDLQERGIPEPFWAFAWAGGQALARFILDHPEWLRGRHVIDFGCGGGVVALAALKAGAAFVTGTEIDPWAIAAARINLREYREKVDLRLEDWTGRDLPEGSLLLFGDMHYEAALTERLLTWFRGLKNVTILIGDPMRGFLKVSGECEVLAEFPAPMDADGEGLVRGRARVLRFQAT